MLVLPPITVGVIACLIGVEMSMPQDFGEVVRTRDPGAVSVVFDHDGLTLVRLDGEVDLALQESLDFVAREAIDGGRPLEVDVSGVTFMDSTGLSLITRLAASEVGAGRFLRVVGVGSVVGDLLRVSGVGAVVAIAAALS